MALRGPLIGTSTEVLGPWDVLAPLGDVLMDGEYVSSLTVEILLAKMSPPLDPWVFNLRMLRFLALKYHLDILIYLEKRLNNICLKRKNNIALKYQERFTHSIMKGSSRSCAAVALSFGSGSKHRRINVCASSDNSLGISGWIL